MSPLIFVLFLKRKQNKKENSKCDSLFEKRFIFLENDLKLLFIFVLFLKRKQNKKENPKCNSLFGKCGL